MNLDYSLLYQIMSVVNLEVSGHEFIQVPHGFQLLRHCQMLSAGSIIEFRDESASRLWMKLTNGRALVIASELDLKLKLKDVFALQLTPGDSVIIPCGWHLAILVLEDCVVFSSSAALHLYPNQKACLEAERLNPTDKMIRISGCVSGVRSCTFCGFQGAIPCLVVDCKFASHLKCDERKDGRSVMITEHEKYFCELHRRFSPGCFFCGSDSHQYSLEMAPVDSILARYSHRTCLFKHCLSLPRDSSGFSVFLKGTCSKCALQGSMVRCQYLTCSHIGHLQCFKKNFCSDHQDGNSSISCKACHLPIERKDWPISSRGHLVHRKCFSTWLSKKEDYLFDKTCNICHLDYRSGPLVRCAFLRDSSSPCDKFFHLHCAYLNRGNPCNYVFDEANKKIFCNKH